MAIVDSYAKLPDGNKACKPTGNRGGPPWLSLDRYIFI